jgi:hypothetical protein
MPVPAESTGAAEAVRPAFLRTSSEGPAPSEVSSLRAAKTSGERAARISTNRERTLDDPMLAKSRSSGSLPAVSAVDVAALSAPTKLSEGLLRARSEASLAAVPSTREAPAPSRAGETPGAGEARETPESREVSKAREAITTGVSDAAATEAAPVLAAPIVPAKEETVGGTSVLPLRTSTISPATPRRLAWGALGVSSLAVACAVTFSVWRASSPPSPEPGIAPAAITSSTGADMAVPGAGLGTTGASAPGNVATATAADANGAPPGSAAAGAENADASAVAAMPGAIPVYDLPVAHTAAAPTITPRRPATAGPARSAASTTSAAPLTTTPAPIPPSHL